jgi:hypothetical protein
VVKLDIGCGQSKAEGFVGIDAVKCDGVDIVHDLRVVPWPIDAESVEEARCMHFFEHLTGAERMIFMDELYRVMQRGAKVAIQVPYWSSARAIQDPTHQWPPVSETSFLYFNKGWRVDNKIDHYPIACDFDFTYGYALDPAWVTRHHEAQAFAVSHYLNAARDLVVTLTRR